MWAMTKKEAERIKVTHYAKERKMMGIRLKDKIKMEHIKEMTKQA